MEKGSGACLLVVDIIRIDFFNYPINIIYTPLTPLSRGDGFRFVRYVDFLTSIL